MAAQGPTAGPAFAVGAAVARRLAGSATRPTRNWANGGDTLTVPIQVLALRARRSATDSDSESVNTSGVRKAGPTMDCTLTTARRRPSISQSTAVSTPHLEHMIH